jgi:lysophospholipase L1-like esterase
MGLEAVRRSKQLAVVLIVLLAACTPAADFEVPQSQTEKLREDYGIAPGTAVNLPSGSRIVFFGDSITAGGVKDGGYVTLVEDALAILYPDRDIDVIGSGVVGDKVSDLARRLRKDVLAKKPTHVVIYVGVNDVASLGPSKAALNAGAEDYAAGLTALVRSINASGAEVMLCTPGVIGEDVDQGTLTNYGLELYAAKVRALAAARQTGLCDLRSEFTRFLANNKRLSKRSGALTVDGLHLNGAGNRLVARTILKAFTGSESLAPTPFVVPTVSPRPQPVRAKTPVTNRPSSSQSVEPDPAPPAPAEPETPDATSSPAPDPPPAPDAIRTPDGFPFEPPAPSPSSPGDEAPT